MSGGLAGAYFAGAFPEAVARTGEAVKGLGSPLEGAWFAAARPLRDEVARQVVQELLEEFPAVALVAGLSEYRGVESDAVEAALEAEALDGLPPAGGGLPHQGPGELVAQEMEEE